jgi:hypothetical protein
MDSASCTLSIHPACCWFSCSREQRLGSCARLPTNRATPSADRAGLFRARRGMIGGMEAMLAVLCLWYVCAMVVAVVKDKERFSLRALFIGATLIAVVLGLAVASIRHLAYR